MDERIREILAPCAKNQGASEIAIKQIRQAVGERLPEAYLELIKDCNGIEGFVSQEKYLIIWPAEQLVDLNKGYGFTEHVPHLFLFGSNGGDAGYAFDTRYESMPVVEVPFVDLSPIAVVGDDFRDFLARLAASSASSA